MNEGTKTNWTSFATPLGTILAIVIGFVFIGYTGGCEAIQDSVAKIIGAPTTEDRRLIAEQIGVAEKEAAEAEASIIQLEDAIAQTNRVKEDAEARQALIRSTYAEAAARLPSLTGAAADAMIEMMNTLQAQLTKAKTDFEVAAALIAEYQTKVAKHIATGTKAVQELQTLSSTLAGFDAATSEAIGNTVGLVKFAGDSAQTLGLPGGSAVGSMAGEMLGGILALVLGGTAASATVAKRKAATTADALTKVVQKTEELGLIRDDEAAKAAKEIARKQLGADVMSILHAATAKVA